LDYYPMLRVNQRCRKSLGVLDRNVSKHISLAAGDILHLECSFRILTSVSGASKIRQPCTSFFERAMLRNLLRPLGAHHISLQLFPNDPRSGIVSSMLEPKQSRNQQACSSPKQSRNQRQRRQCLAMHVPLCSSSLVASNDSTLLHGWHTASSHSAAGTANGPSGAKTNAIKKKMLPDGTRPQEEPSTRA
jgi:hypothetical protein